MDHIEGEKYLKLFVILEPEVTFMLRSRKEGCLIVAVGPNFVGREQRYEP